jgi:hypothetical protein
MADEVTKIQEKKDESAGLGTLLGFGALAVVPFLRPFRNVGKVKRALSTLTEKNAARTTVNEQLMPKLLPAPREGIKALPPGKIKYQVVKREPQITNPLVNDREALLKANALKAFDDQDPQLMFGSSLYDQIKIFPKEKASVDDWLKYFKSKQNVKYNDGRSASIDTEELFDSNIAAFDKSGGLVGGLLKRAQLLNMEVDKNLLMRQVYKNPFNELQLSKFKTPSGLNTSAAAIKTDVEKVMKVLETKYKDETGFPVMGETLGGLTTGLNNFENSIRTLSQGGSRESIKDAALMLRNNLRRTLTKLTDPQDQAIVNNAIRTLNGASEDIMTAVTKTKLPVHATNSEYGVYRLRGEDNPGEIAWRFKDTPKTINDNNVLDRSHRFGKYPIVHAMYGTRYTPQGQKVISINEIQADIQQKVFDYVKQGKARVNPYGKEGEAVLLLGDNGLQTQRDIIDKVIKKGIYATDDELFEMHKAFNTLKSQRALIKKGLDVLPEKELTSYLPFYNNKNYTDLALKTVIKEGADDGAQWVSVVPVEYLDRANGAVLGNQIAYGFSNGAGAFKKGEAVIPELMRKLAKQYKTEAKIIQVSKSDPKKPYKVVAESRVNRYDGTQDNKGPSIETYTNDIHRGAYATKEEAERAARGMGGRVEYIAAEDPNNYLNMFALRISPDMVNKPMKLYKSKGGLIENIFKPL